MREPLARDLRRALERTVVKARDVAEEAALAELNRLGISEKSAPDYLKEDDKDLRRRLRAHGRQLGDRRKPDSSQDTAHLVTEVAYEHWHRMLFARFLAENNLLMYDETTPLSIEECFGLAEEELGDRGRGWQYAATLATKMLPQIFRVDSPVFDLSLAPDDQLELEKLLNDLDAPVFQASDSLGWVYQFWQTKKKDQVNQSGNKIGADELSAVTQLFTEPYMVSFLLDNALGAWWAARRLSDDDLKNAPDEQTLRDKASLPGMPLEYLRFVKTDEGVWTPAAGTFDAWPTDLSQFKLIDPCCGSGHFLVAAFQMLVPIRMEVEKLDAISAADAVLRENIHGLELDQRCVELAAFALALEAWRTGPHNLPRVLPVLGIAHVGQSLDISSDELLQLADGDEALLASLRQFYLELSNSAVLGSLLRPEKTLHADTLFEIEWTKVKALLERNRPHPVDEEREISIAAEGLSIAAEKLTCRYSLIVTNVPFRQSDDLVPLLQDLARRAYPDSKTDLATIFLDRLLELLDVGGMLACVLPQGFLYKDYYSKFRKRVFASKSVPLLARLGPGAFQEISGEEVKVVLSVFVDKRVTQNVFVNQLDASQEYDELGRSGVLCNGSIKSTSQKSILVSKRNIVSIDTKSSDSTLLEDFAVFSNGIQTGDIPRFGRNFWELGEVCRPWKFQLSTVAATTKFGGREHCIRWSDGELLRFVESKLGDGKVGTWLRGTNLQDHRGVAISAMGNLKATLFNGELFDDNTVVIIPNDHKDFGRIWQLCSSQGYNDLVRKIDQSSKVRGALLRVPFAPHPRKLVPQEFFMPYSSDPTQWIFHGHPCGAVVCVDDVTLMRSGGYRLDDIVAQVATARLLGHRWPAEFDKEMELADEQREWVDSCDALLSFADADGIVCLPPVRGEKPGHERLEELLHAAYGDEWSASVRSKLLASVDCANRDFDFWLRNKFFEQHCKLFQHRPFIWQIWDGLPDGFSALLNYHKLDGKNLDRLIHTYLADWIRTQKQGKADGADGAETRLKAAEGLKTRLEQISRR